MNKISKMMFVAFAAMILTMLPEAAMAQSAGSSTAAGDQLLDTVLGLVTGSMGTLIGLGIALFGLYMWLIQQASWGIMVMIGGVALTAFPGIFEWMRDGFADGATGNATASSTNTKI